MELYFGTVIVIVIRIPLNDKMPYCGWHTNSLGVLLEFFLSQLNN